MSLSRDTILNSELHREKVSVPEWGRMAAENGEAHVYVRELRGDELEYFLQAQNLGEADMLIRLCLLCVCDAGGTRIFDSEDGPRLKSGPLAPLRRCAETAMRLNGFMEEPASDPTEAA